MYIVQFTMVGKILVEFFIIHIVKLILKLIYIVKTVLIKATIYKFLQRAGGW
jgi:hypothetical protein